MHITHITLLKGVWLAVFVYGQVDHIFKSIIDVFL